MNNYYLISCYNKEGQLEHFEVPESIYIYVRLLETQVHFPDKSRLKEIYSFRFVEDV